MWQSSRLVFTAVLASLATCISLASDVPGTTGELAGERHHLVTGIETRDTHGHPHIRPEIRDLYADSPDQWALYLLGLQRFQQVDQSDPLSYYRISGIHSEPYELWQDAHGVPGVSVGAYCPHTSRLFITWHRPYLALFEQELWKHIKSIAEEAQVERERWIAAADAFRIPYWDTARDVGDKNIPEVFQSPTWSVLGPSGTVLIDNPLYSYKFHPLIPKDFSDGDIARYNYTQRWPSTHFSDARPQLEMWRKRYSETYSPRQDAVYNAFRWNASFRSFSEYLESAHSWIHVITGGDASDTKLRGHMYDPKSSAFDPVFMLHHANFDRLLALYTAANPDVWLEADPVGTAKNLATFWIPSNGTTDANTGLVPFWKNENEFWTSNDAHQTDVFGYAYPETQHWDFISDQEWRKHVRGTIQILYPVAARKALKYGKATGSALTNLVDVDNIFTDWVIRIQVSTARMPLAFRALFTLVGDASSNEKHDVGMWTRLVNEDAVTDEGRALHSDQEAKRSSSLDQDVTNIISLTSSLLYQIKAGKLESLDPEAVVPYVRAHLTWNIYSSTDSKRITSVQLDGFSVEVTSTRVRIPDDPFLPLEYSSDETSYPIHRAE